MQALRARRRLRAMGVGAPGLLAGIGLLWGGFALSTGEEGDRMSPFDEAPASVHDDLLYLTYIDSLARDDRAVPTGVMEGGGCWRSSWSCSQAHRDGRHGSGGSSREPKRVMGR